MKLRAPRTVRFVACACLLTAGEAGADTVTGQAMLNPFFTGNDYTGWTLNAPWRNDGGNDRLVFDMDNSNLAGFPTAIGQGVDLMTQSAITNAPGGYSAVGARLMDFNFGASDPYVAVFGGNTNNGIYKLFFEVDVQTSSGLYRAKSQELDTPQNLSGALDLNFSWQTGGSFLGDLEANGGTLLSGISSITYKAVMFVDTPASGGTAFFTLDNMSLEYVVDTLPVARWTGGSGEWTTGFSPAFYQEAPVEFSGAGGNVTNNVATNGTAVGAMTFAPGAGSYTLTAAGGASGESTNNPLIIAGNILNNSAATQTLGLAVELAETRVIGGSGNTEFGGVVTGGGNLVKTGTGTLTLTATNTYSGATTISNGTLVVDGRVAGSGVAVKNGGELAGSGTVGSAVIESGGTIAPGNSPGTLTLTNGLTWNAGGNYDWEIFNIAGAAGTGWDLIDVQGGAFTFGGLSAGTPFNINIFSLDGTNPDSFGPLAGLAPNSSYSWKILQHNTAIGGFSAANFNLNAAAFVNNVSSGTFALELGDSDTSLYLVYTTTGAAVPEPGTWLAALLLCSAVAIRLLRRKSREPAASL